MCKNQKYVSPVFQSSVCTFPFESDGLLYCHWSSKNKSVQAEHLVLPDQFCPAVLKVAHVLDAWTRGTMQHNISSGSTGQPYIKMCLNIVGIACRVKQSRAGG